MEAHLPIEDMVGGDGSDRRSLAFEGDLLHLNNAYIYIYSLMQDSKLV